MSRVLSWTVIYLVCTLPCSSSHATRARCGPHHSAPIRVCSGWGLPSRRVTATLVVSYTTVSAFPFTLRQAAAQVGVFFSAALSVGSPRLAVSQHPALWSPDFPHVRTCPKASASRATVWPTSQGAIVARSQCRQRTRLHAPPTNRTNAQNHPPSTSLTHNFRRFARKRLVSDVGAHSNPIRPQQSTTPTAAQSTPSYSTPTVAPADAQPFRTVYRPPVVMRR